jgi:hypothetical protein
VILSQDRPEHEALEEEVAAKGPKMPPGYMPNNELLHDEVRAKVRELLTSRGFETAEADEADYYFVFFFGMGHGRRKTEWEPIYTSSDFGPGYGPYRYWGGPYYGRRWDYYGGWGYGTGVQYVPVTYTVYHSWLLLDVIDAKEFRAAKKIRFVWRGRIGTTSRNSDLRGVLNYLLVAGFEHFGRDTGRRVEMWMDLNDPRVKRLEDAVRMSAPPPPH